MHSYVIDTERLTLRALTVEDAEAAFVWCSDPKVNRFMPYSRYETVEPLREWLAGIADKDLEEKYHFGFVRRSDGVLIGSGSVERQADGTWSIGYNLRSDCWNQGYATEAAAAMIRFAHDERGARDFFAQHAVANPASGKVMEHCGMHFERDDEYSRFDGSETFPARRYVLHLDA